MRKLIFTYLAALFCLFLSQQVRGQSEGPTIIFNNVSNYDTLPSGPKSIEVIVEDEHGLESLSFYDSNGDYEYEGSQGFYVFNATISPDDNLGYYWLAVSSHNNLLDWSTDTLFVYIEQEIQDWDQDGIANDVDNCPQMSNKDQADFDQDGQGDVCDTDDDNDGVADWQDCDSKNAQLTVETFWYYDEDLDGWGGTIGLYSCQYPGKHHTLKGGDCNDVDSLIHPGAIDIPGDGIDQNCDGKDSIIIVIIEDFDQDGIPNEQDNCPLFYNADQADFDQDGEGDVCDTDDDNDGVVDWEDCNSKDSLNTVGTFWYYDLDLDGWGNPNGIFSCQDPGPGYTDKAGDCDDYNASINPGAIDIANDGIDQDCDGEDSTTVVINLDWDNDGIPNDVDNCPQMSNQDQADFDQDGQGDVCDTDDDNDGVVDWEDCDPKNGQIFAETFWYFDGDRDGWGNPNGIYACQDPGPDYTDKGGDCNDTDASINPGAIDIANDGIDQDCDGEDSTTVVINYDWDNDGIPNDVDNCPQTSNQDQADFDQDGQGDVCDSDDDNDGVLDREDCDPKNAQILAETFWFYDEDLDGWGSQYGIYACQHPGRYYTEKSGDCNDVDPLIYPGAKEIPDDGIDQDCDGEDDHIISHVSTTVKEQIKVYPNPFEDRITVQMKGEFTAELYTVTGTLLESNTASGVLEMGAHLETGVYLIKAHTDQGSAVFRVTKH